MYVYVFFLLESSLKEGLTEWTLQSVAPSWLGWHTECDLHFKENSKYVNMNKLEKNEFQNIVKIAIIEETFHTSFSEYFSGGEGGVFFL